MRKASKSVKKYFTFEKLCKKVLGHLLKNNSWVSTSLKSLATNGCGSSLALGAYTQALTCIMQGTFVYMPAKLGAFVLHLY